MSPWSNSGHWPSCGLGSSHHRSTSLWDRRGPIWLCGSKTAKTRAFINKESVYYVEKMIILDKIYVRLNTQHFFHLYHIKTPHQKKPCVFLEGIFMGSNCNSFWVLSYFLIFLASTLFVQLQCTQLWHGNLCRFSRKWLMMVDWWCVRWYILDTGFSVEHFIVRRWSMLFTSLNQALLKSRISQQEDSRQYYQWLRKQTM